MDPSCAVPSGWIDCGFRIHGIGDYWATLKNRLGHTLSAQFSGRHGQSHCTMIEIDRHEAHNMCISCSKIVQKLTKSLLQDKTATRRPGGGGGGGGGGWSYKQLSINTPQAQRGFLASCWEESDLFACLETLLCLQKLVLQIANVLPCLQQLCLQMLLLCTGLLLDQPGARALLPDVLLKCLDLILQHI